jgi:hypothetical protein
MDEIHKVMLMPGKDALCNEAFSPAQWLNYYLNVWTRNLVARTIDVETDRQLKEIDPERPVQNETQSKPSSQSQRPTSLQRPGAQKPSR